MPFADRVGHILKGRQNGPQRKIYSRFLLVLLTVFVAVGSVALSRVIGAADEIICQAPWTTDHVVPTRLPLQRWIVGKIKIVNVAKLSYNFWRNVTPVLGVSKGGGHAWCAGED